MKLAESKKKIYSSIKEGIIYDAVWINNECTLNHLINEMPVKFETTGKHRGTQKVKVAYRVPYYYLFHRHTLPDAIVKYLQLKQK